MALPRITVLISGRGSNLGSLLRAMAAGTLGGTVTTVISNRANAGGLDLARAQNIPAAVVDHRQFPTRDAFDLTLAEAVDASRPDLIVLAGFMRVLTDRFVTHFHGRLINIHPSLLPAYPGLHTHRRALADGVKIHGCTVHFVTPTVDVGPIIAQSAVAVGPADDEATLAARVLRAEHALLPAVVGWYCGGRLVVANGHVSVKDAETVDCAGILQVPAD
ncbi:MAG: phosphoribosylglycinamide formyltransferase [Casimicrobiaceae bacterium]